MPSRRVHAQQLVSLDNTRDLLDQALRANRAILGQINALPADMQAEIPAPVRLLIECDLPTGLEAGLPDLDDFLTAAHDPGTGWTLTGDLSELLAPGADNHQAAERLADYMRTAEPQLLDRVQFDCEADMFCAHTARREDALEVALTVRHLAVTDHARLTAG